MTYPGIDTELTDELYETLGDGFIELIDIFLVDTPQQIATMENCINANDPDGVRSAAHILSGSCSNFGAHKLNECCHSLRTACKEGQSSDLLKGVLDQIKTEYDQVAESLKSLAASLG